MILCRVAELCLRLVLYCHSFSCKCIKINGKLTKCYANKPLINHYIFNVNSRRRASCFTVIPKFQSKSIKFDGLLLICNLTVLNPFLNLHSPSHKSFWFGSIPLNCCSSWLLNRVNVTSSQVEPQFVSWQVHPGPLFSL